MHCRGLTSVTIPEGVTSIGGAAFYLCAGLTSVTIPEGVTSILAGAFAFCPGLAAAIFLGDAPELKEISVFDEVLPVFEGAAPDFSVYFFPGSSGFTSPTWSPPDVLSEYPAAMLDEKETWLLGQGLPLETDLDEDHNGDGYPLLLAYGLDLDPDQAQASQPTPVVDGENIKLVFYGDRPGITYTAQTSTDLGTWTSDEVNLSEPGPDGRRTASVARSGGQGFLRVMVTKE